MGLCATISLTASSKTVSPSTGLGITTTVADLSAAKNAAPIKFGYDCGEVEVMNTTNQSVVLAFYKDGAESGISPTIQPGSFWSTAWDFDEVQLTCGIVASGELWIRGVA